MKKLLFCLIMVFSGVGNTMYAQVQNNANNLPKIETKPFVLPDSIMKEMPRLSRDFVNYECQYISSGIPIVVKSFEVKNYYFTLGNICWKYLFATNEVKDICYITSEVVDTQTLQRLQHEDTQRLLAATQINF